MNYFNKLPTITYDNKVAVNILSRARLSDQTKNDSRLFYPYTMSDGDRVDMLSRSYYGSPDYTWLVWFSNEVIDPYYDLPVSEVDLLDLIVSKYGSMELARRKIKLYRTNGKTDERVISQTQYNSLPASEKKYWEPVLDYLFNVQSYKRKLDVQTVTTNRVGVLEVTTLQGTFKIGEEIRINSDVYGFCTYADSTAITINNINGNFIVDAAIIGVESGATAIIRSCNNAVSTTPAYDEPLYWEAVSLYDYEIELNELKKEVQLMDVTYKTQAEQELRRVLNTR